MLKKILVAVVIMSVLCMQSFAAVSDYRDQGEVTGYKKYLETRGEKLLQDKTIFEKLDLLLRVNTLLDSYDNKTSISKSDKKIINFLIAFEEYMKEEIGGVTEKKESKIVIEVIDDKRCTDCQTGMVLDQIKDLPFLADATFIEKDFSDAGVTDYMKDHGISHLPAFIFNTNDFEDNGEITPYLHALYDEKYSLAVGAKFNPFIERSSRGFETIEKDILADILENSYILWDLSAEITWLEYSDLECPFCSKLHNNKVYQDMNEEFGKKVNYSLQHFPLEFHPNAMNAAMALECIWDTNEKVFYPMVEASFEAYSNNNFSLSGFYDLAEGKGIDRDALKKCVSDNVHADKVKNQMSLGQELFGISGTPGNVLINNVTWEYAIISGAYPYETFQQTIEKLLR